MRRNRPVASSGAIVRMNGMRGIVGANGRGVQRAGPDADADADANANAHANANANANAHAHALPPRRGIGYPRPR